MALVGAAGYLAENVKKRFSAMLRTLALSAALILALFGHADAGHNGVNDRPFLSLVGSVEGPDGYDTITLATRLQPSKPLTSMSIEEVLAFQRKVRSSGANSSAMGRYQFNYRTLSHIVETRGIDTSLRFDRFTQDALARMEMQRCGFYDAGATKTSVANCLAAVWAALPLASGPRRGQSRYAGVAGNRSLVTVEEFLDSLSGRFPGQVQMASGAGRAPRD